MWQACISDARAYTHQLLHTGSSTKRRTRGDMTAENMRSPLRLFPMKYRLASVSSGQRSSPLLRGHRVRNSDERRLLGNKSNDLYRRPTTLFWRHSTGLGQASTKLPNERPQGRIDDADATQYTPCPGKHGTTLFLPLILSNANWFWKFFHRPT